MTLSLPDPFFRTAPSPMWVFDDHTLQFLEVNERACQRYGYSREEFLAMTLLDIRGPEEQKLFRDRHAFPNRNWEHLTKSGEPLYIQGFEFPFELNGKAVILAILADVTERVKLAREKTELLERYRILSEAANDLMWEWDLKTGLVTHTEALVTQYGYSSEDLKVPIQWWVDKIHPDDFGVTEFSVLEAIRERRKNWTCEYRMKRADGSYVRVLDRGILQTDANDEPLRMVGSIVDLTSRKSAEDDRDQLFRLSLDSMLFLAPDGQISQANGAFHNLIGVTEKSDQLKNFREYLNEQDRGLFEKEVASTLEHGVEGRFATNIQPAAGDARTIEWGLITNEAKNRLFLVGRDISELKAARLDLEKALETSQAFATEAQTARKAQVEFLQNMSHELRTPMNGMLGTAQILAASVKEEKEKNLTSILVRSGETLLQILNDILDLSKIESGKFSLEKAPFKLSEVVQNVFDLFSLTAEQKGLAFTMARAPESEVYVEGDPFRLRQVLSNLFGNAIKFTDKGAVGVFLNANIPKDGQIEAVITVRDTGIGIAEDMQSAIFNRFIQADSSLTRRHGGTGLGLSITQTIVELMAGKILVESSLGKGSTFTVTLPFHRITEPQQEPVDKLELSYCTKPGTRVLIAEDVEVNAMILRSWLEDRGFVCETVASGSEAIEALQTGQFQGGFIDLHMPDASGYDVIQAVRSTENLNRAHIPMIAVTASVSKQERLKCLDQGFDDYIPKPVIVADLDRVVARHF